MNLLESHLCLLAPPSLILARGKKNSLFWGEFRKTNRACLDHLTLFLLSKIYLPTKEHKICSIPLCLCCRHRCYCFHFTSEQREAIELDFSGPICSAPNYYQCYFCLLIRVTPGVGNLRAFQSEQQSHLDPVIQA